MKNTIKNSTQVGSCIIWNGAKNDKGYGVMSYQGKTLLVHRISFILKNGTIPNNIMVCHSCDNPSCVNPDHLFLGNAKDNWDDSHKKGRTTQQLQAKRTVHGTRSMYHNGCKCALCKKAESEYQKLRRKVLTTHQGQKEQ